MEKRGVHRYWCYETCTLTGDESSQRAHKRSSSQRGKEDNSSHEIQFCLLSPRTSPSQYLPWQYFLSHQTAQKWEQYTGAPAHAVSKESAHSFPTGRRVPEAPAATALSWAPRQCVTPEDFRDDVQAAWQREDSRVSLHSSTFAKKNSPD